MNYKKVICTLLIVSFISTLILTAPVFAATEEKKVERVYSYLAAGSGDKVQAKPGKPSPTATVNIRNIPSGDSLYGAVLIIAQATGTFSTVVYQVDQLAETTMSLVSSTGRYEASWDTTVTGAGSHTLTVKAKDSTGKDVATSSVSVKVVSAPLYEVRYEIDYIIGQIPDTGVLAYLTNYWLGHAIKVTFTPDDSVSDPTPNDGYISSTDFWTLENLYNDGPTNSKDHGYQYTLPDKWMLYGTYDANSNVGGYTYVLNVGGDYVGGNYIFIADKMIESWELNYAISSKGGEVIVTGHEAGHSIGIVVGRRSETYDTDYYSIMSYMRLENSKYMAPYWYYSKEYWSTANLGYYPATAA